MQVIGHKTGHKTRVTGVVCGERGCSGKACFFLLWEAVGIRDCKYVQFYSKTLTSEYIRTE